MNNNSSLNEEIYFDIWNVFNRRHKDQHQIRGIQYQILFSLLFNPRKFSKDKRVLSCEDFVWALGFEFEIFKKFYSNLIMRSGKNFISLVGIETYT